MTELDKVMPVLLDAAARKADAGQVAALLLKGIPENDTEMNDALFELIMDATWFEQLSVLHDDVKNFRPWFEKLRDELIKHGDPEGVA